MGSYDTTTQYSYGTLSGSTNTGMSTQQAQVTIGLSGNPATTPGNGQTCASVTNCSPQDYVAAPGWFANQPYWNDMFQLLVHPQFAAFVVGGGPDRYFYWGADPALASVQVWQLSACAYNQKVAGADPCQIQYSYSWVNGSLPNGSPQYIGISTVLTLTSQEASNLLQLDPFYVAGTQDAALDTARAAPFPGPQTPYGMKFDACPVGQTCPPSAPSKITSMLTNTEATSNGINGQNTYTATVTDVSGSSNTIGQTISMTEGSLSASFGLTVTSGDKQTSQTQTQTIYKNSTAAMSTVATQEAVTLNDCDNTLSTCKSAHAPMPQFPQTLIYLDKIYGGFMFQDPNAPPPLPSYTISRLINSLNGSDLLAMGFSGEQSFQRFPDVAKGSPEQGAIGVLAVTGILPGMPDGKFYPQSALSRVQLATAIASYLNLSEDTSTVRYSDVPPRPRMPRA